MRHPHVFAWPSSSPPPSSSRTAAALKAEAASYDFDQYFGPSSPGRSHKKLSRNYHWTGGSFPVSDDSTNIYLGAGVRYAGAVADPLLIDIPTRIDGERVSLRAYRAEDAAAIDEAARESQPELAAVFPWASSLPSVEERSAGLKRGLACFVLRTELAYGIWRREDGRYLGDTGLFGPDWHVRRFEIGYWLRTAESGKGYATEAARLLVDLAFGLLEARRVFVRCDVANQRSAGVPLRLGFEHEGTLRNETLRPNGEPADVMVFGMTPDRWSVAVR